MARCGSSSKPELERPEFTLFSKTLIRITSRTGPLAHGAKGYSVVPLSDRLLCHTLPSLNGNVQTTRSNMPIESPSLAQQVVHAWLGVVRSPWLTTLMQVGSRIVLVWGFMWVIPPAQEQLGVVLCITSWAAVEIPRCIPCEDS